jgi:acetyltransferase-like isoleucine patch superfamily enzyme
MAFGNNVLRKKWIEDLLEAGFKFPVLIHPTAYVSPSVEIGQGSIVCAKAVVYINTCAVIKACCKVDMLEKVDAGE